MIQAREEKRRALKVEERRFCPCDSGDWVDRSLAYQVGRLLFPDSWTSFDDGYFKNSSRKVDSTLLKCPWGKDVESCIDW